MTGSSQFSKTLTPRQLAEALLAGLVADRQTEIIATQRQLHRAFRNVLKEVGNTDSLDVDLTEIDYDPLYGLSGWLDEFLARAQRDLMISAPNPSYGRIEIRVTPVEAEQLLAQYPNRAALEVLSKHFYEQLSA